MWRNLLPRPVLPKRFPLTLRPILSRGPIPVTLSVSFEYYDKDAKLAGEAALSLSLPVGSVDRIRFNSLSVPMENYVGNDVSLSYSIINAGFTTLYNAEILVYDDTDTLLASKYVGTVEPSKEIKGNDISLNFMSAGDYNLRMVFQYEDEMLQVSSFGTDLSCHRDGV